METSLKKKIMDFSLFFFSSNEEENQESKYKLLLDSTKYADENGLSAVWIPERHYNNFGGLYPNPAVVASALAVITKNLSIRSGSIVSPLHHTTRIAEDWAVVDNLSGGRIGLSFAAGWHPNDFINNPNLYLDRKNTMIQQIKEFKNLWSGRSVTKINALGNPVEIYTYPKPLQQEPPLWLTTGGSQSTYIEAGAIGANILTHLFSQDLTDLKQNIEAYHKSLKENGFDPSFKNIAVMLHTYIGDQTENIKKNVKKPFIQYLQSHNLLSYNFKDHKIKEDEKLMERLLDFSFERYWDTASMLGTISKCSAFVNSLNDIGVTEVACLIDFGLEYETVMKGLKNLSILVKKYSN
ncbi:MupA/Atu3671 family FMN-dependent luciferase-like monooxygenase [Cytobacillus pseudoceanisediminis]|uniref:MupA/Atu3671 family FMN-dependent luciferase-like monooxygenase n=1 Tax=Cytobacillus pseudoceanisediminis TaxID=3051614 RepID=UPI003C2D5519